MKIMVVDDHPVMLKMMASLLGQEGHEVKTAKDGLSALDMLETYIPDVIFVDLVMPNIGGDKLCRIIRDRPELKDVYLVIFSDVALEHQDQIDELGADASISKGPGLSKHVFAALDQYLYEVSGKKVFSKLEDPLYPLELEKFKGARDPVMGSDERRSRQISQQLISSKKHFETILNSLPYAIVEVTPEGRIILVNPAAVFLTGIPEERLLGSAVTGLFPEDERDLIKSFLETIDNPSRKLPGESVRMLNGNRISLDILPIKEEENRSIVLVLKEAGQ
jgi:PAS domain S-box-containing protein